MTWLPQAESGIEGTAIALGAITATASSLPGHSDSVQSLVVSGIPVGAVLTDGKNCFVATSGNTSVDVESWNFANLKITPPNNQFHPDRHGDRPGRQHRECKRAGHGCPLATLS